MNDVTDRLNIEEAIGVGGTDQLEQIFLERGLFAGIEFHHPNVNNYTEKFQSNQFNRMSER